MSFSILIRPVFVSACDNFYLSFLVVVIFLNHSDFFIALWVKKFCLVPSFLPRHLNVTCPSFWFFKNGLPTQVAVSSLARVFISYRTLQRVAVNLKKRYACTVQTSSRINSVFYLGK